MNALLGGPLEQGDIEDFDGREKIVCPWHSYDFDLETGDSSYGLKASPRRNSDLMFFNFVVRMILKILHISMEHIFKDFLKISLEK